MGVCRGALALFYSFQTVSILFTQMQTVVAGVQLSAFSGLCMTDESLAQSNPTLQYEDIKCQRLHSYGQPLLLSNKNNSATVTRTAM